MYTVAYANRKKLPNIKAVYAVFSDEKCLYVGSTIDLHHRINSHNKRLEFEQNSANIIVYFTANSEKELKELEGEKIRELQPLLNTLATRRVNKQPKLGDGKANEETSLRDITFELLQRRCADLHLNKIAEATGIPLGWLKAFNNGTSPDPSVNRVQTLYNFLTGEKLKLVDISTIRSIKYKDANSVIVNYI